MDNEQSKILDWRVPGVHTDAASDTAPMVQARRIKRAIEIQERNTPRSTLFDVTTFYMSDRLPQWFTGLQSIVEDEYFTSMVIQLDAGSVKYHIRPAQCCSCTRFLDRLYTHREGDEKKAYCGDCYMAQFD